MTYICFAVTVTLAVSIFILVYYKSRYEKVSKDIEDILESYGRQIELSKEFAKLQKKINELDRREYEVVDEGGIDASNGIVDAFNDGVQESK